MYPFIVIYCVHFFDLLFSFLHTFSLSFSFSLSLQKVLWLTLHILAGLRGCYFFNQISQRPSMFHQLWDYLQKYFLLFVLYDYISLKRKKERKKERYLKLNRLIYSPIRSNFVRFPTAIFLGLWLATPQILLLVFCPLKFLLSVWYHCPNFDGNESNLTLNISSFLYHRKICKLLFVIPRCCEGSQIESQHFLHRKKNTLVSICKNCSLVIIV